MTRLLDEPVEVRVEAAGFIPRRVELPGAGWHDVVAVCARWRVDTDWWRDPVVREYWKLGLRRTSGSSGSEPDVLCDVFRDPRDRWCLSRVYD